tara:strand:+ start:2090 stop:2827 length:738 start_codon:yes stop_codon:yes gene_type:complete
MMNILIIGESCRDIFHYGDCTRLCPEAPVPVFNTIDIVENGGMAMNVYNNVMAMGASGNIETNKNWHDITKTRFVDKRSNHMFMRLDQNDSNYGHFDIRRVDLSLYDGIIVSDYNKGFLSDEDIELIGNSNDLTIIDTKRKFGKWIENFSFIKVNDNEYEQNAHMLSDKIKDKIIITRGPRGCTFRNKTYSVPPVEVKDPSGAGDTFVAALCVKYCQTRDINMSIQYANDCATLAVQKRGVVIVP